jgi:hypothetical protein
MQDVYGKPLGDSYGRNTALLSLVATDATPYSVRIASK